MIKIINCDLKERAEKFYRSGKGKHLLRSRFTTLKGNDAKKLRGSSLKFLNLIEQEGMDAVLYGMLNPLDLFIYYG